MFNIDEIYSVTNFLQLCNKAITKYIPLVWVQGEVSNISTPSSGHIYFSIKDDDSQIHCALFRLSVYKLQFKLENGLQIMVRAATNIYENRGDFQLIISSIEIMGVGNLELGFEQLKAKLVKEGLFAEKNKKPLPLHISTIGVITAKSGAVINDIISIIGKRYPFVHIIVYDSLTQGDLAAGKLIYAIQKADKDNKCDVLIIARGGGSREDLWCFNDEGLVRAVFAIKTPVISSIGHKTDTTLIDFVSDKVAPTPSAAAAMAVPDKMVILQQVMNNKLRIVNIAKQQLSIMQELLIKINNQISSPNFYNKYQVIDNLLARLINAIKIKIKLQNTQLQVLTNKLKKHSLQEKIINNKQLNNFYYKQLIIKSIEPVKVNSQRLIAINNKLLSMMRNTINHKQQQLIKNIDALDYLDPLKILIRNYSITSINNRSIRSIAQIKLGDVITTKLTDGKIKSKIIKINKDNMQ